MLSHQNDLPGPSSDLVGGANYEAKAPQYVIRRLEHLIANVDSIFELVAPEAYQTYRAAHERAKMLNPHVASAGHWFDSAFSGLALIYNRRTPRHKDGNGGPESYDALWPCGDYRGGELRFEDLNFTSYYGPDTFVLLRGGKLAHEVLDWEGAQRFSVVFFSHKEIFPS